MTTRISILWTHPSGYLDACVRALVSKPDVEVQFVSYRPSKAAPFVTCWAHDNAESLWLEDASAADLRAQVDAFAPDLLLVCSWIVPAYRSTARAVRGKAVRAIFMDNQWHSTPKQLGGRVISKFARTSMFDIAFVPAERQRVFARTMGFSEDQIYSGGYCADTELFSQNPPPTADQRGFITAARLAPEKGLTSLLDAYARYRALRDDPWPLTIAGAGEMTDPPPGVDLTGFLSPDALAGLESGQAAFVLPSRFEPWGVALHEAAAAGLLLLATEEVGAADWFIVDGVNGFVTEAGSTPSLLEALLAAHDMSVSKRAEAHQTSRRLGLSHTPAAWAQAVLSMSRHFD